MRVLPVNNLFYNNKYNKIARNINYIPNFGKNTDSFKLSKKKISSPKQIREEADKVLENSHKVYRLGNTEFHEVVSLIEKGRKSNYRPITTRRGHNVNFKLINRIPKQLEEIDKEGKILRVADLEFSYANFKYIPSQIQTTIGNDKKNIYFYDNNKLISCIKGPKTLPPNGVHRGKRYNYTPDGKLTYYQDGPKHFEFKGKNLKTYREDSPKLSDGTTQHKKEFKSE